MATFCNKARFLAVLEPATPKPNECHICLEPYEEGQKENEDPKHAPVTVPSCGHVFGKSCLASWINHGTADTRHTCPLCRGRFPNITSMTLARFPLPIPTATVYDRSTDDELPSNFCLHSAILQALRFRYAFVEGTDFYIFLPYNYLSATVINEHEASLRNYLLDFMMTQFRMRIRNRQPNTSEGGFNQPLCLPRTSSPSNPLSDEVFLRFASQRNIGRTDLYRNRHPEFQDLESLSLGHGTRCQASQICINGSLITSCWDAMQSLVRARLEPLRFEGFLASWTVTRTDFENRVKKALGRKEAAAICHELESGSEEHPKARFYKELQYLYHVIKLEMWEFEKATRKLDNTLLPVLAFIEHDIDWTSSPEMKKELDQKRMRVVESIHICQLLRINVIIAVRRIERQIAYAICGEPWVDDPAVKFSANESAYSLLPAKKFGFSSGFYSSLS